MENQNKYPSVEAESKLKKYFRIPERISHLVGVFIFYAAVFLIISILAQGLKFFNVPDAVQSTSDAITGNH